MLWRQECKGTSPLGLKDNHLVSLLLQASDFPFFPVFRDASVSWGSPKASPLPSWHPQVLGAFKLPGHPRKVVLEHVRWIPAVLFRAGHASNSILLFHLKMAWAYLRASPVAHTVKNPPAMLETWVQSLGQEDSLEKEMVAHSSILAWRIP